MHLPIAILSIALLAGIFLAYAGALEENETRERHAQSVRVIKSAQYAVYEWHAATRQNTDITSWQWPTTTLAHQRLISYLPHDPLTGEAPSLTVSTSPSEHTLLLRPLWHGAGNQIALTWVQPTDNPSIELRLLGTWTDEHRDVIQAALPNAIREDTDTTARGTLALSGTTAAIRVNLPHPANQAVLSNAMRRSAIQEGGRVQGLVSPLVFEPLASVLQNNQCGQTSALATNNLGVPMACIDHDANPITQRIWRPLASTHVYCRDTRLTPGDPNYTLNAPNHVPVIATNWLDGTANPGTAGYDVRIPALSVSGLPRCPLPFTLEPPIPGLTERFCIHTFN